MFNFDRATPLSDLTFTEDGNPDELESNLINWAKRELICTIIQKIQMNKHPVFNFPIVEPLHTFLVHLPCLTDKEIYEMSLQREPKTFATQRKW